MDDLTIHEASRLMIRMVLNKMPHAVLVTGPIGVGLETVSRRIAGGAATHSGHVHHVVPEKGSISIDEIRKLYEITRSRPNGRRIILIHDADSMRHEAQNALLKLLEEPSPDTHFVLSSHLPGTLLPTIRSRVQEILLHPVSKEQSVRVIKEITDDSALQAKLSFVAAGLPAELHRMHNNTEYFDRKSKLVRDARSFLTSSTYDKLRITATYNNDRELSIEFLHIVGRLLIVSSTSHTSSAVTSKMMAVSDAIDWLKKNANVRLQLMTLALN